MSSGKVHVDVSERGQESRVVVNPTWLGRGVCPDGSKDAGSCFGRGGRLAQSVVSEEIGSRKLTDSFPKPREGLWGSVRRRPTTVSPGLLSHNR